MAETLQLARHPADGPTATSTNGADFRFERAVSPQRVAVIDIGSNSTRMEVLQITADYDLRVVSEVKSLLRLQSRMNAQGQLERSAIEDLKRVVKDFATVAAASRVDILQAVATASIRAATNGQDALDAISAATDIDITIVDGFTEARYGFLGAITALPVEDGILVDIGGGSVELTSFRDRELIDAKTTELGALRVTDEFLRHDPPKNSEVRALRRHIKSVLTDADIPELPSHGTVVGAGGTVRNIAKIDRANRGRTFSRLHGAIVNYNGVKRVIRDLKSADIAGRCAIAGLNPERSSSILGGTIVMGEISRFFGKRDFVVSGRGLREGMALDQILKQLPTIEEVRRRSVYALGQRFDTWNRMRADRRAALATKMLSLLSDQLNGEMGANIAYAARIIDTGRSINYYDRYDHAANIIEKGELGGFSHRDIGLMAAAIRYSNDSEFPFSAYRPYVKRRDMREVRKASVILRIADEMERRLDSTNFSRIAMTVDEGAFVVTAPELKSWDPGRLSSRFRRLFKMPFVVR